MIFFNTLIRWQNMKEVLKSEIFYIEFWHIFALLILLIFNTTIYLKSKKTRLLYFFLYIQANMVLWFISKILKTVSPTIELRWFFICTQYLGICLLEVSFMEFAYIYAFNKNFNKLFRAFLYIISVIQFIIIVTNPYHHLFYSKFNFYSDSFGPLFYIHMAIEYMFFLVGIYWCSIKFKNMLKTKKTTYVWMLSTAVLFPFVFNIIYLSKALKHLLRYLGIQFVFDITPMAFTLSLFLFTLAIFRYEFFDIVPVLKEHTIDHIDSAIIILNRNNQILEYNQTADRLFKIHKSKSASFVEIYKNSTGDEFSEFENDQIVKFNPEGKEIYQLLRPKAICNLSGYRLGTILSIHDITDITKLKFLLQQKNKAIEASNQKLKQKIDIAEEAAAISARNFVARELHDILGHSMTLVINLLESARCYHTEDEIHTENDVKESLKALKSGYCELKASLTDNSSKKKDTKLLQYEIKGLADVFRNAGLNVKLYFSGDSRLLDNKEYYAIKRMCQEALTNSMKHGKSSEATVSINFVNGKCKILIIDNGNGCKVITKNNGLKSMEQRLSELNGTISCNSEGNRGFIIYAEF